MFDTESDKAIVIFEDQKIKFHNAEHKYYVVIQTLEFIEKFLGKESHHYAAVKSFSLPNSFPDTSDSLYDIKLRNTERRFNACIDGIVDTIIKVGINFTNQGSEFLESAMTQSVTTTPSRNEDKTKSKSWYNSIVLKYIVYPVLVTLILWFVAYLITGKISVF
jgi:hypothetical protein